ncbi:WhiB family transcriptional regulator [Streptomyces shenzhenensis]|uniref:WhiB family transcriptional regulator n=1 Tax=Streptomyces shenzhenensis TaxID=943815 RepID=UPI0036A3990C
MSYSGSVPDTHTRPTDWLALAPCKDDPDAMFPGINPQHIEKAKAFCRRCTAVERCLQWALDTGTEEGVWGGLTEAERRPYKRTGTRTISIDDYTGIPATRARIAGRTHQQAWDDGIEPDGDHILWVGPKTVHHPDGPLTPNRLSFFLDRGRWAEGEVRRTCGVDRCVKPGHLADQRERDEAKLAAAA